MDGTLVYSTGAIEHVWSRWADQQALSRVMVLQIIYGVRITNTVKTLAPPFAEIERRIETLIAEAREQIEGITTIPSGGDLIKNLPHASWAAVTSANPALAAKRSEIAGIPEAPMLIAEEDVARRKPNPDGFQLAAQNLGKSVTASIVFEDSPSGLEAGRRAGCRTIAITATLKATLLEPPDGSRVSAPFKSNMTAL
jgi:sugar-phosphatase